MTFSWVALRGDHHLERFIAVNACKSAVEHKTTLDDGGHDDVVVNQPGRLSAMSEGLPRFLGVRDRGRWDLGGSGGTWWEEAGGVGIAGFWVGRWWGAFFVGGSG